METINFRGKAFEVVKKFPNKKLHVRYKNRDYVLVPFNDENGFTSYLAHKKMMKKSKIEMPRILKKDKNAFLILEQFIEGDDVLSLIASNRLDEKCYNELFRVYRNNRFAKVLLSYKPENFIKHKKYFYYTGDFICAINEGIAFERGDDILLWLSTMNQKRYIESKGYTYLEREMLTNDAEIKKKIALLCVSYW